MNAFWDEEKSVLVLRVEPPNPWNHDASPDLVNLFPVGSDDSRLVTVVTTATRERADAVVVENLNQRNDARVETDVLASYPAQDDATL